MCRTIRLKINGELHEIFVRDNDILLDVLRNKLDLTGTKKGCETGDCGACTIFMDGKIVKSCLILAVEADGKNINTIEGLAENGQLHPIQEAFINKGAVQCGFCTPGMIMSAKALLDENSNPTKEEIKKAIAGNLCRCTGYARIEKAISAAAKKMQTEDHK